MTQAELLRGRQTSLMADTPQTVVPVLDVNRVTHRFGEMVAVDDLSLEVRHGELVSLLGPSGCGKSTTLRIIAGLQVPDEGRIKIRGTTVVDTAVSTVLPPEKRDIGMVFQSYAIWPHMTVFDNVAFPLRLRRVPREEKRQRVTEVLRATGLSEVADKPATRLSGGQQQRVALARALVFRPSLMLLDEPLSNLDAQLREQMRMEIKRLQRDFEATAIFVTHDQEEAMSLSDRIAVMNGGRIEQIGTPQELYTSPATPFTRDFLGHVLTFKGAMSERGGQARAVIRGSESTAEIVVERPPAGWAAGDAVLVTCRPEDVEVRSGDRALGMGEVPATVLAATYLGPTIQYRLVAGPSEMVVWLSTAQVFDVGSEVVVQLDPARLSVWKDE